MKRSVIKCAALIFLMLVAMALRLPASSFSAEGFGESPEAARLDAQVSLASYFSTRVISQQRLSVSEVSDGKKVSSLQHFAHDSSVDVSLKLLGVRYSDARRLANNSFTVTAHLDASTLPQYLNELKVIKGRIEEVEGRDIARLDDRQQRTNLLLLLGYYDDFEAYAAIARALDEMVVLPELLRTKAGVELDYWNLLDRLERTLEAEQSRLKEAMEDTIRRQEASELLVGIQAELETNRAERQEWLDALAQRQEATLKRADTLMRQQIITMQQAADREVARFTKGAQKTLDPLVMIGEIEKKKQSYQTIKNELNSAIDLRRDAIWIEYQARIAEVEAEPYRVAELAGNRPTDYALSLRKKRIDALAAERNQKVAEATEQLSSSVDSQLKTLEKEIKTGYQVLEKHTYSLHFPGNEAALNVGGYDAYRRSWPVALRLSLVDVPFSLDFYVPYAAITGKRTPNLYPSSDAEFAQYEEYLNTVDLFEAYFSTASHPFFGTLSYRVFAGERPSTYRIAVESYVLKRTDSGATVLTEAWKLPHFEKEGTYQSYPALPIDAGFTSQIDAAKTKIGIKEQKIRVADTILRDRYLNPELSISIAPTGWFTDPQKYDTPAYIGVNLCASWRQKKRPALRVGYGVSLGFSATKIEYNLSYTSYAHTEVFSELFGQIEVLFPLVTNPDATLKPGNILAIAFLRCDGGICFSSHQDVKSGPTGLLNLTAGLRLGQRGKKRKVEISAGVQALGYIAGTPIARVGIGFFGY